MPFDDELMDDLHMVSALLSEAWR